MRTTRRASLSGSLSLAGLFMLLIGCSPPVDKAVLEGVSSIDLVGGSETLAPDGQNDVSVSLQVAPAGTIIALTVHNVDGQAAAWDTIPNNGRWLLGVADKANPRALLNKSDGTVDIKVEKGRELLLYLADNGAVRGGKTSFSVTVVFADGTKRQIAVERVQKTGATEQARPRTV